MLKTQRVYVEQEFNVPVARLFAILSEHESLNQIYFPAKFTRIKDGVTTRNGVGSARKMTTPLAPSLVETIQVYQENKLIEYTITSGIAPIKNHKGVMKFIDLGDRSSLQYTIQFKGQLPFIGPIVRLGLQNAIRRGLKKLKV